MPKARFPPLSQRPLVRCRKARLGVRTSAGEVVVETVYGQDPETGAWVNPLRELWGLEGRQEMSPVLEERLCYTATLTGSYETTARVAAKWGVVVEDSTIHAHVQRAGARAETACQERVERALSPETRGEVIGEAKASLKPGAFSLVIMMDGWMVRERGAQWGLKPPETPASRVEWHEMKTAIVFRLDQRGESQSGRRMIVAKAYVCYRGDPFEFGRGVYAEALRRGLNQAERVYVVADGGVWIWNIVEDRFGQATGVLDFYHAAEHLWTVARAMHADEEKARQWVEPLLHQLNHGGEAGVLKRLDDLLALCIRRKKESARIVEREVRYFATHRDHLHYHQIDSQGCPKGSGAVESACSQFQDRFKRTGQFWTLKGENHLLALELARRNDDWDQIWQLPLVA